MNQNATYDYLRYGSVDHNVDTFEEGIQQVAMGHYIEVDLENNQSSEHQWYVLKPKKWDNSFEAAKEEFYFLLKDSVRLRMRSDVPLGSALSGGLDSSTVVCLMREILNDQDNGDHPIKTVTSCFEEAQFDEWRYAEEVIKKVNARPHRVFPSFEKLVNDLDRFLWHMDYPFASTSQFSQWCVFEGAAEAGLKVMIDGQGADEQLAGYGGNDMSLYTGLLRKLKIGELIRETAAYRQYHQNWPTGFLIGAIQNHIPKENTEFIS